MRRLRYAAIRALDWIDDRVLRHSLHRFGLCDWIAWHPWWGPERWGDETGLPAPRGAKGE